MRHRTVVSMNAATLLSVHVLLSAVPANAQTATPRTAWEHPDLQGIWDFRTITPLERPKDLADQAFLSEAEATKLEQERIDRNEWLLNRPAERTKVADQVDQRADGTPGFYNNFWLDEGVSPVATRRTSLILDPPNGRLPSLSPPGQERARSRREYRREHPADSWLDRSTFDRCLLGFNAGPPITPTGYNQNLQVFQTPDHVVLVTEMVHTARIVPLDGRPAPGADVLQWSGNSRGYWEGDTLVIETSHFHAGRRWRGSTSAMRLVERLTRIDADLLEYTFTVTDPDTWERSWTASIPMRRTELPMHEYACHEGNYSMTGILAGARAAERQRR